MKAPICLAVAILFFISSFAQHEADRKDALLRRSVGQRTAGFITLGIGTATLIPGLIMLSKAQGLEDLDKGLAGTGLAGVGFGCIVASAVCFINADRSVKKADRIKIVNEPVVVNTGLENRILPYSVGIGIPIN